MKSFMKAKLCSGQIIDLPRDDCGCPFHEGPHWFYTDALDQEMNRQECLLPAQARLDQGAPFSINEITWLNALLDRFAKAEAARLRLKRLNMERFGIVEIIKEDQYDRP